MISKYFQKEFFSAFAGSITCFLVFFPIFFMTMGCSGTTKILIPEKTTEDSHIRNFTPQYKSSIKIREAAVTELWEEPKITPPARDPLEDAQAMIDQALEYCDKSKTAWQKGKMKLALENLDLAYSMILKVNTDTMPDLIQQKEDIRLMISRGILEIYASISINVKGSHKAIPVTINKYVQKEINLFTIGREKRYFLESYKRSGKYRAQIVKQLKKAGLPPELSWLPLIESGFKVKAFSKARALGLWQFIPSTGYKFGLKRNLYVDERLDPSKSTRAAVAYLKQLHNIFGDWSTVLAAYNCGEGRVLRIIKTQRINYLDNFWDLYAMLPKETIRYVPRFLATLYIVNHPEKYGLDKIKTDRPASSKKIIIAKQVSLQNLEKAVNLQKGVLSSLNPELRYKVLPNENYALRIPMEKEKELLSCIGEIQVSPLVKRRFVRHRVRSGETLSLLAKRYHTSILKIARNNSILSYRRIRTGKILRIPCRAILVTAKVNSHCNLNSTATHIVARGDSLWSIAKSHKTTIKNIKGLNGLRNSKLQIGQILKIPHKMDKTIMLSSL